MWFLKRSEGGWQLAELYEKDKYLSRKHERSKTRNRTRGEESFRAFDLSRFLPPIVPLKGTRVGRDC